MKDFARTAREHVIRSDIEGLRALAVISVLVNHAFPKALPGGFVGVDVFFVISGYLIGRHLLQDIQDGRLSIRGFYAKRARRIFPALALVLIAAWGVGWLTLSASEFFALGKHVVASVFFSNNILLWSESGYFDVAALDKPLLHLWSLGIEEQFYLLVPVMLWLGSVGTAGSVRWVARFGALSLLATIILGSFDYPASFYLLHTRFWELAAGVVLAQAELRTHARRHLPIDARHVSPNSVKEVMVFSAAAVLFSTIVLGSSDHRWERDSIIRDGGLILMIIVAILAGVYARQDRFRQRIFQYADGFADASSFGGVFLIFASAVVLTSSNWPGAQTLFPVLGTVMLIAAARTGRANKVLGTRPLVFIGGISYPLYLWHWPVIVTWRLLEPGAHGVEMAVPLAISFLLAWLTKALLEEPVRFGKLGFASFQRPKLRLVVAGLACAAALGSFAVAMEGVPSRIPPQLQAIAAWSDINPSLNWRAGRCYQAPQTREEFSDECTPVKRPDVPLVLLWGDSHAAHLYPGLANAQSIRSFELIQWTAGLCPPTVIPFPHESMHCPARRATALKQLMHLKPDTILLAGAWELYLREDQSEEDIIRALSETVRRLREDGDLDIVLFGPGPTWNTSLATDLYRFMVAKRMDTIPERFGWISDATWHLDAAMAARAAALNVRYVSVLNYFCNKSGCRTVVDRTKKRPDLLYSDSNHLTVSGSQDLIAHSNLHLF